MVAGQGPTAISPPDSENRIYSREGENAGLTESTRHTSELVRNSLFYTFFLSHLGLLIPEHLGAHSRQSERAGNELSQCLPTRAGIREQARAAGEEGGGRCFDSP